MQPADPFPNPSLAPTDAAGNNTDGARYGCSRVDSDGTKKMHYGLDLLAAVGTSCVAIYDGVVSGIVDNVPNDQQTGGLGNRLVVRSTVNGQSLSLMYCHLSQISVANGQIVTAGTEIGKTGRSGNAFDVPHKHLHLAASSDRFLTSANIVDPEPYLKTTYKPHPNPNPKTCT